MEILKISFFVYTISLAFILISHSSMAQNISANASAQPIINLTCLGIRCTNLIVEVLNRTFFPAFFFNDPFNQINCTLRPIVKTTLLESAHELSCIYPLQNFSSQEQFEKGFIPIPLKTFQQFGNLSVDFSDYEKKKAENLLLFGYAAIMTIGILAYVAYNEAWSTRKT